MPLDVTAFAEQRLSAGPLLLWSRDIGADSVVGVASLVNIGSNSTTAASWCEALRRSSSRKHFTAFCLHPFGQPIAMKPHTFAVLVFGSFASLLAPAANSQELRGRGPFPNTASNVDRPLRYVPQGSDFVIENGPEFFNRALYGGHTAFRAEAGDKPEFTMYLPGRGGNLRLGLRNASEKNPSSKWLHAAQSIDSRYRPGAMIYDIRDPLLGPNGTVHLEVYALASTEGLIIQVEARDIPPGLELLWAYGGANGERGGRDGDIGTERVPISEYFQLKPEFCVDNTFETGAGTFKLTSKSGTIVGRVGGESDPRPEVADADKWKDAGELFASVSSTEAPKCPVVAGHLVLKAGEPRYIALQRIEANLLPPFKSEDLPKVFHDTAAHFQQLRERVIVNTPDPYIDAAVGALNVAADAAWDDSSNAIMHGAIAWRRMLLGWRGPYSLDTLGWHDRARLNIHSWISQQNTTPIPDTLAPPDEQSNLARSETALHSNGDMSNSHYDMNLVFIDVLFRHILWTGDVKFAAEVWPVIERHLAWEQRLFRRPFGPEKLPLYENYAATWASDDLYYSGGGTAHASAYNYYHNTMAARIARLIGKDPAPYEREAELILRGMREFLWLQDKGWYAEYRDLLGRQLAHPSAALWNVYHVTDSQAVSPIEAWQLSRYVDEMPHIPVRGPGVPTEPDGKTYALIPTTTWMPYSWSINNVCMNEDVHMALSYWQAGRDREGYLLLKSSILACMYMGIAPGNVGTMTYLDVYRRESQRDFADGSGMLSRAMVEGLFGIHPDGLAGELHLKPGFPEQWDHASIRHPQLSYSWKRTGQSDAFTVESLFDRPMSLRLSWPALSDDVAEVTVNGSAARWQQVDPAIGRPCVLITAPASSKWEINIRWKGNPIAHAPPSIRATAGDSVRVSLPAGLQSQSPEGKIVDPQKVFVNPASAGAEARVAQNPGTHTVFVAVKQGAFSWLMPVDVIVAEPAVAVQSGVDWSSASVPTASYEAVDLAKFFNLRVTEIFKQEYRSPRSPYVSLAIPKQGIGGWAGHVNATANIDDSGLRRTATKAGGKLVMPNGVPFNTPGAGDTRNIAFTSQWDNFPKEITVPLGGKATRVFLLMAGSTNFMQSRFENGEVVVTYTDGTTARLALTNPTNWWPIEQDYFLDDYQFKRPEPIPPRVNLKTGEVRLLDPEKVKGRGRSIDGGAANVLDIPLDPTKELKSLTVRTIANDAVIGLMSATLQRETVP